MSSYFFSNIKFILKRSNFPRRIYVKIKRSKALRGSQKQFHSWEVVVRLGYWQVQGQPGIHKVLLSGIGVLNMFLNNIIVEINIR